nr:uncharacterized protein LOC123493666 [Aegilops tauschii subsp. strangulata]
MAPKNKKFGPSAHPSTSKALPPAASNAMGDAEMSEDVSATGGVVGAGGAITTSPAAGTGTEDVGGEQHQQRLGGHAPQGLGEEVAPSAASPPTDGHNHNNGTRSEVNHRPPAAPTAGATAAHVRPPGRVDQTAALNGAGDPRAPPPRDPAARVVLPQLCGRGTPTVATAGTIRSRATMRSTSSTPMPSIATEAMARAQLLLLFPPAAELPPSKACSVSPKLGAHGELAHHDLPKRQQPPVLLAEWRGPSPRCRPHHGSRRGRS